MDDLTLIDHDNTYAGPEKNMLHCNKCGDRIRLQMLMPAKIATAIMLYYSALHQYCHLRQVFVIEEECNGRKTDSV